MFYYVTEIRKGRTILGITAKMFNEISILLTGFDVVSLLCFQIQLDHITTPYTILPRYDKCQKSKHICIPLTHWHVTFPTQTPPHPPGTSTVNIDPEQSNASEVEFPNDFPSKSDYGEQVHYISFKQRCDWE